MKKWIEKMKNASSIIIALLGIGVGALTVLTAQSISRRSHRLDAGGADWRKVNLVLKCIDENYVDSIDHKKVTDEVAAAALSALIRYICCPKPLSRQKRALQVILTVSGYSSMCLTIRPW